MRGVGGREMSIGTSSCITDQSETVLPTFPTGPQFSLLLIPIPLYPGLLRMKRMRASRGLA